MRDGRLRRTYLGLSGATTRIGRRIGHRHALPNLGGVHVEAVEPGGPGAVAGLESGDLVVSFAGMPMNGVDDLHRALTAARIGMSPDLRVLRGGRLVSRAVTPPGDGGLRRGTAARMWQQRVSVLNFWSLVRMLRRLPLGRFRNPHFDPTRPHHLQAGFRNTGSAPLPGARARAVDAGTFAADSARRSGPRLCELNAEEPSPKVSWIGHSTVLVQAKGMAILTDPIFSARASPLPFFGPKRVHPPGIPLRELPRIDVVLVSHAHYDHCDVASLRKIARLHPAAMFMVPLGLERVLRRNGIAARRIRALDWWEDARIGTAHLRLLPVHHWSARSPWDTNTHLWGAWSAEQNGFRFFFSGDLAFSDDIREIARREAPYDLAAIAVGHYEPRSIMARHHVNPDEAVRIHKAIRARRSLGIHWGTFIGLTAEPLDQPVRDLAMARAAHGVAEEDSFVLRHGETACLDEPDAAMGGDNATVVR